jgi:hypothetical protein
MRSPQPFSLGIYTQKDRPAHALLNSTHDSFCCILTSNGTYVRDSSLAVFDLQFQFSYTDKIRQNTEDN